ncbi:hypothetical protein MKZ38_000571 [Zalerion maritima]|uniref:PCI domain-containing protein n=1 Tax=Zalerion maritima TaxID=339359 RepID=A0AAD5WTU7_9PEZI|nr:hypothetical protein MKZ38_000571 [Zalerion maritima]
MALLSSASSPRMAADLILRATSTPGAYVFSELLYHPNVQSLAMSEDHQPHLKHLQIFAHGTHQDYLSDPSLPPLNDAQTLKLRQLSLISLASDLDALSYANLQKKLALNSPRELEEFVISAIYANLLTGTLDPARQSVSITSVSPLRDAAPASVPKMQKGLQEWSSRCVDTLQKLEEEIRSIKSAAAKRAADAQRQEVMLEALAEQEKSSKGGGGGGSAASQARKAKRSAGLGSHHQEDNDEGAMDLDEDDDGGEKKRGRRKLLPS